MVVHAYRHAHAYKHTHACGHAHAYRHMHARVHSQRFSLFDEHGISLKNQWETLIADATKRLGGSSDNRCRITVTDQFGGRGHDYQVCMYTYPMHMCICAYVTDQFGGRGHDYQVMDKAALHTYLINLLTYDYQVMVMVAIDTSIST